MKATLSKGWNRFALVGRRVLRVIAVLLTVLTLSDWPFYALSAKPLFDFGWGGLLVLVLAYILWDVKGLAESIRAYYIGPWQEQAQEAQVEASYLSAELEAAQATIEQLNTKLNKLEANI